MTANTQTLPPERADKYIIRFERPNHRAELKAQAALAHRSLNKHILHLIEQGEVKEQARDANAPA